MSAADIHSSLVDDLHATEQRLSQSPRSFIRPECVLCFAAIRLCREKIGIGTQIVVHRPDYLIGRRIRVHPCHPRFVEVAGDEAIDCKRIAERRRLVIDSVLVPIDIRGSQMDRPFAPITFILIQHRLHLDIRCEAESYLIHLGCLKPEFRFRYPPVVTPDTINPDIRICRIPRRCGCAEPVDGACLERYLSPELSPHTEQLSGCRLRVGRIQVGIPSPDDAIRGTGRARPFGENDMLRPVGRVPRMTIRAVPVSHVVDVHSCVGGLCLSPNHLHRAQHQAQHHDE